MSTYIGPFVRVKLQPIKYVETINTCPDTDCKKHDYGSTDASFCSVCGSKIEAVDISRDGVRGWGDFLEDCDYEFEDVLYGPEYLGEHDVEEILLCNTGNYHKDSDGGVWSLADMNQHERVAFIEKHQVLLDRMKQFFGDNLTIDYGVCTFWS